MQLPLVVGKRFTRDSEPLDGHRRDGQPERRMLDDGKRRFDFHTPLSDETSRQVLGHGNSHVEFRSNQGIVMGDTAYPQVLPSEVQRYRRLTVLENTHLLCGFVDQFVNRMRTGIEQHAIDTREAEQSDREVLCEQFVKPDDAERLYHADAVL